MGANFTDYLREAHRCLKLDGRLHIAEATSRFTNLDRFCRDVEQLGFDIVGRPEHHGQFTFIHAVRANRQPNAATHLSFGE